MCIPCTHSTCDSNGASLGHLSKSGKMFSHSSQILGQDQNNFHFQYQSTSPGVQSAFYIRPKVIKGKTGEGHVLFLDLTTKGTLKTTKGTVPYGRGLVRTLIPLHYAHAIPSTYHYTSSPMVLTSCSITKQLTKKKKAVIQLEVHAGMRCKSNSTWQNLRYNKTTSSYNSLGTTMRSHVPSPMSLGQPTFLWQL